MTSRSLAALVAVLASSLFACADPDTEIANQTPAATPPSTVSETNAASLAGNACMETFSCENGSLVLHRVGPGCEGNASVSQLAAMYEQRTVVETSLAPLDRRVAAMTTELVRPGINEVLHPCR